MRRMMILQKRGQKTKWEKPEAERLLSTAGGQFEGEYQMGDV